MAVKRKYSKANPRRISFDIADDDFWHELARLAKLNRCTMSQLAHELTREGCGLYPLTRAPEPATQPSSAPYLGTVYKKPPTTTEH